MTRMVRAAVLTNYFEIAQHQGLNPAALVTEAGLNKAVLSDPDNRIPATAVIALLEASARTANCPTFGLRMAESRQLSHLGAVSLLLMHQRTLRDVLLAMINFRHLLNESLAMHIEDVGNTVIIREEVITDTPQSSRQAIELALGVLMRACSALLGSHWSPRSVRFTHAAPPDQQLHWRLFKCKVEFGAEFNGFVCAAADLDYPIAAANPILARYAEHLLKQLPDSSEKSTAQTVRDVVYLLLPMGRASIDQVAQSLMVNVRTLQRQLDEEGETFSHLINSVRRELVVRYIESHQHSLGHIAELLGYSTQTSFTRWFKAEFGIAPAHWQKQ